MVSSTDAGMSSAILARELPLNVLHRQAGAAMQAWLSWTVPARFSDPKAEYQAIREACGLIDWSVIDAVEVQGADRIPFLHNLLSQDLKGLQAGLGRRAALLTPNAKLLADLLVLADTDRLLLLCLGTRTATLLETLERYRIVEDVTARALDLVCLALQGPGSPAVITQTFGAADHGTASGAHELLSFGSVRVRCIRQTITGEPGYLLLASAPDAAELWRALGKRARPVGWEELNVRRIEAGIPWYGIDMDDSTLLPETGLEAEAASQSKGCYIGQEVIARLATYGSVSRKLLGWQCAGTTVPQAGDSIMKGEETIGAVTSGCVSFTFDRPIGLAYVKRPHYAQPGSIEIARPNARLPGMLLPLPFAG